MAKATVDGAKPAIGVDMEGEGLIKALINALAVVNDAAAAGAGEPTDPVTITLDEPLYTAELTQETDGTVVLTLVAI